jgi:hypothetical protein
MLPPYIVPGYAKKVTGEGPLAFKMLKSRLLFL